MEKLKLGKIYKLIDNTNNNIYIGSTIVKLNQRLREHKNTYNRYINNKYHYVTSFEIIKNNNYRFEIIKYVVFKDRKELHQKERYYIENNICVNKFIPTRTQKEYENNNKIRIKTYHNDNKEHFKEYQKQYNKIKFQCECGISTAKQHKSRHEKSQRHINLINSK